MSRKTSSASEAKTTNGGNRSVPPLRVYRVAAGLTQAELAAHAGISSETVSNIERGVYRPHPLTAKALADGLGGVRVVRVEDLFPPDGSAG